jgi:predicted RNA-binding Zn-ribbon protein involved in translation (DUF1610 family)
MAAIAGEIALRSGTYHCERCHRALRVEQGQPIPVCPNCGNDRYGRRT